MLIVGAFLFHFDDLEWMRNIFSRYRMYSHNTLLMLCLSCWYVYDFGVHLHYMFVSLNRCSVRFYDFLWFRILFLWFLYDWKCIFRTFYDSGSVRIIFYYFWVHFHYILLLLVCLQYIIMIIVVFKLDFINSGCFLILLRRRMERPRGPIVRNRYPTSADLSGPKESVRAPTHTNLARV